MAARRGLSWAGGRAGEIEAYLAANDLLGGGPDVPVYASSLPPEDPVDLAHTARECGHRASKPRIGFGAENDLPNLAALRRALGADADIMVDANQSLQPATARAMIQATTPYRPFWVEEPIAADSELALPRCTSRPPSAAEARASPRSTQP